MAKAFGLHWVASETVPGSNFDASWGWRLLPVTPTAYTFAQLTLSDVSIGWIDGIQACAGRRDVFVLRDKSADLGAALKSLLDAGFSADEIEVVGGKPPIAGSVSG